MSAPKEVAVGSTVYFWFAANTTAGAAGDGATPLYDVRKAGDAAGDAPTASGTPTLLTHANYTDGLHEIAIDSTGYTADAEYAVFCTLTISSVNPGGFCGSFIVRAVSSLSYTYLGNINTKAASLTFTVANQVDSNVITKTGFALSAAGVTAIWAEVITGTTTAVQAMRGFIAAMLGKASGLPTAPKYRNIADTKNVIDATTDADGNRTAVTLDLT